MMASQEYKTELRDLIATFSVTTPNSYVLRGRSYSFVSDVENADSDTLARHLVFHIGNMLYLTLHCRQEEHDYRRFEMMMTASQYYHDNRDFVELLSMSNTGQGTWEPGWEIRRIEKNGQIAVQKDGLTLWVLPQQFIPGNERKTTTTASQMTTPAAKVGKKGQIAMVKEFRFLLPGFYMANGNAPLDQSPTITRVYWNVKGSGAAILLKHVTTELNNENVPFQFKILNNPNSFMRADAGVLYMNKRYLERSKGALVTVHGHVKPFLKPQVPLFAKRLAQGVSLAEDPNNGESFGQHRSRLLAEALYHIHMNKGDNTFSTDEKVEQVSRYLKSRGIDIVNRPYLNSASYNENEKDDYDTLLEGVFD